MVRLRLGRFAWELYYTRTRAVLPRAEVRRRVALVAGHLGYITGLFEYVMTDMLWLRAFALSGCVLIVGYQMAQPKIQKLSAGWNTIFSLVNIYHIALLLRKLPPLSEEEASLLDALAERLTRSQFHALLQAGEWRSFGSGERLAAEGSGGAEQEVFLISSGECDVVQGDVPVGRLTAGGVVGEVGLLAEAPGDQCPDVEASASVVARGGVRCLCLPRARLQKEPELQEALQGVFAAALAAKVDALPRQWTLQRYAALLQLAAAVGPGEAGGEAVLAEAEAFGEQSGLSDEERRGVAEAVQRALRQPPSSPAACSAEGLSAIAATQAAAALCSQE